MPVTSWISFRGGVNLVAKTHAEFSHPNVVIFAARIVHTPVGSAPSALIVWAPDPTAPAIAGFVSTDPTVAGYFGHSLFAGTPYEHLQVMAGTIETHEETTVGASSRVLLPGLEFEVHLSELGALEVIDRPACEAMPFLQKGLEAVAGQVSLSVNGQEIDLVLPDVGISGGAPAVWAACEFCAR